MKIAVVILNWNGMELLKKFLPSVVSNSDGASIYIADNASTDDSVSFIQQNFPQVKIIQNTINGGYAKGYNDALKKLKEDIFILLNSDVEVSQDWLVPIQTIFEREPETAAIQPKILDYKKQDHFEYAGAAGGFIDKFGYPFCRGRIFDTIEEDYGQYNDETYIFWASGACLAIRSENFWGVGGLDEHFFAHQEEIDLCWRLQNQGYKIKYTGDSKIYHVGGATLDSMNPQKTFFNFRNSLFLLLKNVPKGSLFYILFIRMILDGVAGIRFLSEGKLRHFSAILRAHANFYKHFRTMYFKRKSVIYKKNYFQHKSIVVSYFLKGKRDYKDL